MFIHNRKIPSISNAYIFKPEVYKFTRINSQKIFENLSNELKKNLIIPSIQFSTQTFSLRIKYILY